MRAAAVATPPTAGGKRTTAALSAPLAAWVDSIVQLTTQLDIDAECARLDASSNATTITGSANGSPGRPGPGPADRTPTSVGPSVTGPSSAPKPVTASAAQSSSSPSSTSLSSSSSSASSAACARVVREVSSHLHNLSRGAGSSPVLPESASLQAIHTLAHRAPQIFRLPHITEVLLACIGVGVSGTPAPAAAAAGTSAAQALAAATRPGMIVGGGVTTTTNGSAPAATPLASSVGRPRPLGGRPLGATPTSLRTPPPGGAAASTSVSSLSPTAALSGVKPSAPLSVLCVALLDGAYRLLPPATPWPLSFVRAVVGDYFGRRHFVEHESAASFVKTITAAFNDENGTEGDADAGGGSETSQAPEAAVAGTTTSTIATAASAVAPRSRYPTRSLAEQVRHIVEEAFASAYQEACGVRGGGIGAATAATRVGGGLNATSRPVTSVTSTTNAPLVDRPPPLHFLRFLSLALGYRSLRHFCCLHLESWLSHAATNRAAKRLLVMTAEELGRRYAHTNLDAKTAAALQRVNLLRVPLRSPLTAVDAAKCGAATLHTWSRAEVASVDNADLHSIRLLMQMSSRVRSGGAQSVSNTNWDDTYLDAIGRLVRGRPPLSEEDGDDGHSSRISPLTPTIWRLCLHSLLACDWSTSASLHGWSAGVQSTPAASSGSSSGVPTAPPAGMPPLLYSPTHFLLKLIDTLLRTPPAPIAFPKQINDFAQSAMGTTSYSSTSPALGLSLSLCAYTLTVLDRPELIGRIKFILRRAAWLNGVSVHHCAQSASSAGTTVPPPVASVDPLTGAPSCLDPLRFASLLLAAATVPLSSESSSSTPPPPPFTHSALSVATFRAPIMTDEAGRPIKVPVPTETDGGDADTTTATTGVDSANSAPESPPIPAAVLLAHLSAVAHFQRRREVILTELVGVVAWAALVSAHPIVALQSATTTTTTGTTNLGPSTASSRLTTHSTTVRAHSPPNENATGASRSSLSTSSDRRSLIASAQPPQLCTGETALRRWRFAIADLHASSVRWMHSFAVDALQAEPQPVVLPGAATSETPTTPSAPATPDETPVRDAHHLFSELLTALLGLFGTHQHLLQPHIGSHSPLGLLAAAGAAVKPPATSSSSSFYLSDLWPLDLSFLKKSSMMLMDRLPLREESVARLVQIALASPEKLPRAHTIQILEVLMRRVCLLAAAAGRKYDARAVAGEDAETSEDHAQFGLVSIADDHLLESILRLSQFPTPVPPAVALSASPVHGPVVQPPLLAQSSLFWRSCVLLVLLSSFNPNTIGRRSWEQVPCLRCLLEMVVSEIWLGGNTPGGAPPTALSALFPPFPDLISKSLLNHKVSVEVEAILHVENLLPDNRTGGPRTKETSLYLAHNYLMLLDPSEILRRPPEHILQTVQKLVSDFQLGARLRASAHPNFLSNMLSRQTPEQYLGWMRNLIVADPTAIDRIPHAALAEMVMHTVDRVKFEPVRSVINGGATTEDSAAAAEEAREEVQRRRKLRCISRQSSALNTGPTSPASDPIFDHLPAMVSGLRRALPNIAALYGIGADTNKTSETPLDAADADTGARTIMAVISPPINATAAATTQSPLFVSIGAPASTTIATTTTPATGTSSAPSSSSSSSYSSSTFLDLLCLFLSRLNSRSSVTRRSAARALHLWLCPQSLPTTFGGPPHCGVCIDSSVVPSAGCSLSGDSTPALPPATCWLRFFFTWFLHAARERPEAGDAMGQTSSARSSPPFSPSFLSSGASVVRRLRGALMAALEVENDADTLYGYIAVLHAMSTRFGHAPTAAPDRLDALDVAMRVCDVVVAREISAGNIVGEKKRRAASDANGRQRANTGDNDGADDHAETSTKKQRLDVDSMMVDSMAATIPIVAPTTGLPPASVVDLLSEASLPVELLPVLHLGSLSPVLAPSLSVSTSVSASASPPQRPISESPSPLPTDSTSPASSTPAYCGYSLLVSVLSSALSAVEYMQDDEPLIRRMLTRDQPQTVGLARGVRTPASAGQTPIARGDVAVTPPRPPQTPLLKRRISHSQTATAATPPDDTVDTTVLRRESSSDLDPDVMLMDDAASLNDSGAMMAVDAADESEEFVTLHRSWSSCTQPILAYVPLPLLHGIVDFLAIPYAIPMPPATDVSRAAPDDDSTCTRTYQQYQHLLSLLLPSAPGGHAVCMPSPTAATDSGSAAASSSSALHLPIKSGASWLVDHSGIQWPMPSPLQAEKFLDRSTTPMLLLLAIDVCSPNQLLTVIAQFGIEHEIVRRIIEKLDAWARYQMRLAQKQHATTTTGGGGAGVDAKAATVVAPNQTAALSPAMRELITQRPKVTHFVKLYQAVMRRAAQEVVQDNTNDDVTMDDRDETTAGTTTEPMVPGGALLAYLDSLSLPADINAADDAMDISKPVDSSDVGVVKVVEEVVVSPAPSVSALVLQLLCGIPVGLDDFTRLHDLCRSVPSELLASVRNAFDTSHAHLSEVAPLLQTAIDAYQKQSSSSADQGTGDMESSLPRELFRHMQRIVDELETNAAADVTSDAHAAWLQLRAELEEMRTEFEMRQN